jgi:4-hydroxybenzoate polyprenyltransferase
MRNRLPIVAHARSPVKPNTRPIGALLRAWTYQAERFPLATHAPLIAAFSFCTLSYSLLARGQIHVPTAQQALVAFGVALLFFFQMRVADEFKDAEDDARYRPYRPVPRGLVTLRELGLASVVAGILQVALVLWLSPALLPFLLVVWAYFALMSKEFFASAWLRAHPITYMASHMAILPLVDLFGTACDWRVAGAPLPAGLGPLLLASYCNGFVLEIGRKLRAPADEETGVETYSALWGRTRAVAVWLGVLAVTALWAILAANQIHFTVAALVASAVALAVAGLVAWRFLQQPVAGAGKRIEMVSGAWSFLMYLGLGAVPLLLQVL